MSIYEVLPRYTAGSPAAVDEATARRVAQQEREAYPAHKDGTYGPAWAKVATSEGLDGIVIRGEGSGKYQDIITGREYGDMPYGAIRHPETLYARRYNVKGRLELYFYRRQGLCRLPKGKTAEANHWDVLRALEAKFGIDPTSNEAELLWKDRVTL